MIMEAWEPHKQFKITGTLVKTYPTGITIDDARGVRFFVQTKLIIGTVEEG